eukprot:gene17165-22680_t
MTSYRDITFEEVRAHRTRSSGWIAVHGKVYDITSFIGRHPGGSVILTSLGRDATVLFETHHNLVQDIDKINKILSKMQIGVIPNYKPIAKFDSPFAVKMLGKVREYVKDKSHRDSFYGISALLFFYVTFFSLVAIAFYTGSLFVAPLIGVMMGVGHLAGHAGNHWSLSSYDWLNKLVSVTCTNLWGLRERYWEFSHLISHHCYNYTDRDYIMEQHVPLKYFRVRETDEWKPIHAYQHIFYLTTPITSFFVGALRLDCAPWIFAAPLLAKLRMNKESPAPAPQFFASGSNIEETGLKSYEDGVGPANFVVYDTPFDTFVSLTLANIIWLPLFVHTYRNHGFLQALLLNSISFGVQASIVTKSLLTQHLCEDIKLDPNYESNDDWYGKQVEASTSIVKNSFIMWMTFAISFQTEHHMFPALNPKLLLEIQPIVREVAEEYKLQYNFLPSDAEATKSVYRQFKKLGKKPLIKSD